MKHILRIFMPLIVIIIFVNLYFTHPDGLLPVDNYPIWMKSQTGERTDQTSGLSYVGMNDGKKIFISADDVGKINRLTIDESINPPGIEITEIAYSDEVNTLFDKFKRKDMEDIFYDKINDKIMLSIEGHEYSSLDPEIYRKKEGIYEITFNNDILTFDSILTIKRMKLPDEVYMHTTDNIGFEGFSATENYLFLGLENYQTANNEFTDSTVLYIVDRSTGELKNVGTKTLKITSISGLYAPDDQTLYGIDRNRRNMFYIKFNEDFSVNKSETMIMDLSIPLHDDINTILGIAPESITFDDDGDIYVSIDPWQKLYKPNVADKKKLSDAELKNFYDGVPMLYKFKNTFLSN